MLLFVQRPEPFCVSCVIGCFTSEWTTSITSRDVISVSSTSAVTHAARDSGRPMRCVSTPATQRCVMKTSDCSVRGKKKPCGSGVRSELRWVLMKELGLMSLMSLKHRRWMMLQRSWSVMPRL